MPDRVTVDDDALISTDVDKLIKTISAKKIIELAELGRATGIGHKNMEKWIHVLEEEGYIKVEYKLTKAYVSWIGQSVGEELEVEEAPLEPLTAEEEKPREEEKESPFKEFAMAPEKSLYEREEEKEHKVKKKVLDDLVQEGVWDEEAVDRAAADEKESKLSKLNSEPEPLENLLLKRGPPLDKKEKKDEPPDEPDTGSQILEMVVEERESDAVEREAIVPVFREKGKSIKEKREIPLKEKVDGYLSEINSHRKEIDSLKKEKESLYRDHYLKLESKVEADIVSITERILEKEGRILALKERLLELPDKVEEADKLQRTVEKIGKEGRSALENTRKKVSSLIKETEVAEEDVSRRISEIKGELDKGQKKIVELEESVLSINSEESKLRQMLSDFEKQITELNEKMKSTIGSLEDTTELKVEITEMTDQLKIAVDRRERQLSDLTQELEDIKKVENWVKEYVGDYEKKIDEIESYVANSEDEMDKLREAAEREYISKYLKELENVTRIYEDELEGISSEEKNIEGQITNAKQRLSGLIDESQQMIRKLYKESETGSSYDNILRERKERTSRVKEIVDEKEQEKERLSEDVEKAKKRANIKKKK